MDTNWDRLAKPRICGLLAARPTRLSQAMHNAAFRALGLEFFYSAIDTTETAEALNGMRVLGIRGLSLTIPHKEIALPLVDELSPEGKAIGAVNTVINSGEKLRGENTDWLGALAALRESGIDPAGKKVVVLGAGGASRALIYALRGAGSVVHVCNRTPERAKRLASEFKVECADISFSKLDLGSFDMLVNTTPVGSHLADGDEEALNVETLRPGLIVFDTVTVGTPLIREATKRGAQIVAGSRMLLHQAVKQFELFTGEAAPVQVMDDALQQELAKMPPL